MPSPNVALIQPLQHHLHPHRHTRRSPSLTLGGTSQSRQSLTLGIIQKGLYPELPLHMVYPVTLLWVLLYLPPYPHPLNQDLHYLGYLHNSHQALPLALTWPVLPVPLLQLLLVCHQLLMWCLCPFRHLHSSWGCSPISVLASQRHTFSPSLPHPKPLSSRPCHQLRLWPTCTTHTPHLFLSALLTLQMLILRPTGLLRSSTGPWAAIDSRTTAISFSSIRTVCGLTLGSFQLPWSLTQLSQRLSSAIPLIEPSTDTLTAPYGHCLW